MLQNLIRASAFVLAASSIGPPASAQTPPLKIGFVYVSPIGEAGWTYQHEQGRIEMQKALGASVATTVVESVPEGADSERVIRDLAAQGHRLIFATSFGYLEPTLHVAALCLGEADLSLCLLGRFVGRDCRIGGRQRFAGRAAQTSLGKVRAVDDRQDGECQDQGAHDPSFALTSADDTV